MKNKKHLEIIKIVFVTILIALLTQNISTAHPWDSYNDYTESYDKQNMKDNPNEGTID